MAIAPKLSPVLNIAIAGHASERLAKSQHTSLQIKEAIAERISALSKESQNFIKLEPVKNIYNADESLAIRILTGQVDGTDQLAIQLAQENHYKLACIVPDDRVEALDYPSETLSFNAQKEAGKPLPEEIYQQRDDLLLVHANLLMVVWDGDVSPRLKSGTTWLVQQALLRSIPIYWLDISQPTLTWHTNRSQGKLSIDQEITCQQLFYNWNDKKLADFKKAFFTADNKDTLSAVIEQLFLPTEFNNDKKPKNGIEPKKDIDINDFFTHNFSLATTGGFEKTMHALVRFKFGDVWKGIKSCFTFGQNKHENMFTFADLAANDVSGRYRNSIWLSFLLSASAVIVAVIGALPSEQVHDVHEAAHHAGVHWTTYAELVLITLILWLVYSAKLGQWHQLWLPLRAMSEMLKYHTDLKDVYGNELGIGALSTQALRMPSSTWEHWVFKYIYKAQPLADQSCLTTKGLR
ncbi:MAG: hypothetical protein JHC38_07505, partial [Thiotrichales bacterium]|nr:hypothetical protein [Thiotrichales bacterium]